MSVFHSIREFSATPAEVFAAIQDPARLARWWGPEGFRNTFHTFEFRAGGAWLFTMHGPDGSDYPNESEFVEVLPAVLVKIKHLNLPHFDLTLSLEACAAGTRLTWHAVFEDHEFAEGLRQFLETANSQNLDRLALELSGA